MKNVNNRVPFFSSVMEAALITVHLVDSIYRIVSALCILSDNNFIRDNALSSGENKITFMVTIPD
ncbi:hypothetical protein [Sporocytophaga myxococcoides]|nr:hypothetical protein [Sporocytophaga myxococcoides]